LIKINHKNALLIVLTVLFIALVLFIPKIFLRNNIYYMSKDINKMYAHYISLQEENRFLEQQLEDMKFKNQIIDSLLLNPLIEDNQNK
jgi:sensor histidine kinase YesM